MSRPKTVLFTACSFFPKDRYDALVTLASVLLCQLRINCPDWRVATDFPVYGLPVSWGPDTCIETPEPTEFESVEARYLSVCHSYDVFFAFYCQEYILHRNALQALSDVCLTVGKPFYLFRC